MQPRQIAPDLMLDIAQAALGRAGKFDLPAGLDRQAIHFSRIHFDEHAVLIDEIIRRRSEARENSLHLRGINTREEVAARIV